MRYCKGCDKHLSNSEFHKKQSICKDCGNAYRRAWRAANPDKVKAQARKDKLKLKYGLTLEAYKDLLAGQGGHCALCPSTEDLVVDHNHKTGEVRGILCRDCNCALGLLKDSPVLLNKASSYLIERGYYG